MDVSYIGGILTGDEILNQCMRGYINIIPSATEEQVGPNSYDLHIGDELCLYNSPLIDPKKPETYAFTKVTIPEDGYLCVPGGLYLASTKEQFGSSYFVPIVTGRSSIGRLGISVHQEAGFGDLGYFGKWTLQIKVSKPTIIYPNMRLAQVYFISTCGDIKSLYHGKYVNNSGDIQPSLLYEDPDIIIKDNES